VLTRPSYPALPFALSRAVVIDVYDILQSKEDKATVPIYYEARLAKIDLKPEERLKIGENHRAESPDPRREQRLRLEAYSWVTVN
jgi:type I restriction enzyme, R subunit